MKAFLVPQLVLQLSSGLALSQLTSSFSPPPVPLPQSPGTILTASQLTNVLFHPSTGKCVVCTVPNAPPTLGPCNQSDTWEYTPQKFLTVKGTYFCLKPDGSDKPARLRTRCSISDSQWDLDTNGKTRMSTKLENGDVLCLAVGPEDVLFTSPCVNSDAQLFEFATKDKAQDVG